MNIEQARFNMIEQQIRPWHVSDPEVLQLLSDQKRENYFPEHQKTLAFFDTELPLSKTAFSLAPKIEARIVQDVALKNTDMVLLVGAGNGYLAALLAAKAKHVTIMETQPDLLEQAKSNLEQNGVSNVSLICADALKGNLASTFDLIVVNGSLEVLPDELQKQLNIGGRMFVTLGKQPVMTAQLIQRESELFFNSKKLFETCMHPLSQAVAESTFKF